MLTRLSNLKVQSFASLRKLLSVKDETESIKRRMKKKLIELFDDKDAITLISKKLKVFPALFNQEILKKMLESADAEEYLEHIRKCSSKNMGNRALPQKYRSFLLALDLSSENHEGYLECYINYLRRTVDMNNSDKIMQLLDCRVPDSWFRTKENHKRVFIYNHGPTNSGKTFHAINELKALSQAEVGIYLAPLRLLAWQTQQKLGKCNLVTGQQIDYQNSNLTCSTAEAMDVAKKYDVVIIDEVQMIGDRQRGWAWTRAILGSKASRVHLCGDNRALHLVSQLIALSGGRLEERKYNRLSKLILVNTLFTITQLQPGDCLISFSTKKLYGMRSYINWLQARSTGISNSTAIIYGKMPPACRKSQAEKFNSGELPYLVSTDAIGMGLNLQIKRIIFTSIEKPINRKQTACLQDHAIRQIAGRAGRGLDQGYVLCTSSGTHQKVKKALEKVNITIEEGQSPRESPEEGPEGKGKGMAWRREQIFMPQRKQKKVVAQDCEPGVEISPIYDNFLSRKMKMEELKLERAGLFFPLNLIEGIKIYNDELTGKNTAYHEIAKMISELSHKNKKLYFIEEKKALLQFSEKLHTEVKLSIFEHFKFIMAFNARESERTIIQLARQYKKQGRVLVPPYIKQEASTGFQQFTTPQQIKSLQIMFSDLEAYEKLYNTFWLNFTEIEEVHRLKQEVCNKIQELLDQEQIKENSQGTH